MGNLSERGVMAVGACACLFRAAKSNGRKAVWRSGKQILSQLLPPASTKTKSDPDNVSQVKGSGERYSDFTHRSVA